MPRIHTIPFSTNAVRVAIALAHKGVEADWLMHSPGDRSHIRRVSGQDLVPVLVDGELVVHDSPVVLRHLEERFPDPPLWPADPARRAEVDVFIDWFNRVWKVPPNAIDAELAQEEPDRARIAAWERELCGAQDVFEGLLQGREHLLGEFSAADVIAWPFLRYALGRAPGDDERFHRILSENLLLEGRPRLEAWLRRVGERPGTSPNPGG
jgi:maleylpyruvate isomerase